MASAHDRNQDGYCRASLTSLALLPWREVAPQCLGMERHPEHGHGEQ